MLRRSTVPGPLLIQTMVCPSTLVTQSDDEKSKPSGAPEVSWLLRTSYLTSGHQSADRPAAKAASDKLAAAPAEDIASRVAAIEDTFQAAAEPPRHATNPELTAEEVLPSTSCGDGGRGLGGLIMSGWVRLQCQRRGRVDAPPAPCGACFHNENRALDSDLPSSIASPQSSRTRSTRVRALFSRCSTATRWPRRTAWRDSTRGSWRR